MFIFLIFVAPLQIHITACGAQEVGESLTLDCTITDTSGSGNSLEIEWIYGTTTLQRSTVTPVIIDSFPVYTNSYIINQLNTSDEGRTIYCMANRTNPPAIDSYSITLDVTGKFKEK